ncbi:hypothetical protein ACJ41O_007839 [Fusarium nematophilum]
MEDQSTTKDSLSPGSRPGQYDGAVDEDACEMSRSPSFNHDTQLSFLSEENDTSYFMSLEEEMNQEKERYPGAGGWAPDEERLFEILFMRQDLPMLPSTWDVDFRGVPISDTIFKTSDDFPPIIYAHSKDFRATMSLTRLIDLTAKARTSIQSGFRSKVSHLIKREVDKYLSWAAQDGSYAHLRIVPNVMTEVVDTSMREDDITQYIQSRMRSLAKLQREFLREDRDPQFWDVLKPGLMSSPMIKVEPDDGSPALEKWPRPGKRRRDSHLRLDELSSETPTNGKVVVKVEPGHKRLRLFRSSASGPPRKDTLEEEQRQKNQGHSGHGEALGESIKHNFRPIVISTLAFIHISPPEPHTPPKYTYRRQPPVVYGLFILNTSVLVLTIDSAKGPDSYVSFHVQVDFQDEHQSVWNALTIALVVCLARDELRVRAQDFDELPCLEESDPDA